MKKIIISMLVVVMCLALGFACGTPARNTTPETSSSAQLTETTTADESSNFEQSDTEKSSESSQTQSTATTQSESSSETSSEKSSETSSEKSSEASSEASSETSSQSSETSQSSQGQTSEETSQSPEPAEIFSLTINYVYTDNSQASASYTSSLEEGRSYSVNSPAIVGYTANKTVVSGTITQNTVVKVTYTANEYTITFNANGGSVGTTTKKVTYNSTYGTLPTPTKSGSTFLGWYTAKTNGTKITSATIVKITQDKELFAIWQDPVVYTLTINYVYSDNSQASASHTEELQEGSAYSVTSPTITGYTANKTVVSGTISQNTVVKVTYTAKEFTITFNANGGSVGTATKNVTYNSTYGTLPTPTKWGATFSGWYTATTNGTKVTADTIVKITKDKELFAIWQESEYVVVAGSATQSGSTWTSQSANTMAIKGGQTFATGTLEMNVKLGGTTADTGIVFGVQNPNGLNNFWEDSSISYYFFFLSRDGVGYLGKVLNGGWNVCGFSQMSINWSGNYRLAVSIEKVSGKALIRCFANDVLYVSYSDANALTGTQFGFRTGTSGTAYSSLSTSTTVKGKTESLSDYTTVNGTYATATGGLKSSSANAMAVKKDAGFIYGSLEVKVVLSGTASDNGLVFSLSSNATSFWEGNGTSYYFFFVSQSGTAFLGKTDNGNWSSLAYTNIPNFSNSGTYTLKVIKDDTTIYGYVNGVRRVIYADPSPLSGTQYGVRAGSANVTFSNMVNISSGFYNETHATDITVKRGDFVGQNGDIKSKGSSAIALYKTSVTSGTLTVKVTGITNGYSGVVFNYVDNNNYYVFYTERISQTVRLGKFENGNYTVMYSNYLSAGYSERSPFTFKVVFNSTKAYCYFFNTLYTTCQITSGRGVGFNAENPGTLFSDYSFSSDSSHVTVDTLLFGHSYFELWDDWVEDFATVPNIGTYTNIGIGGSIASQWYNFREALLEYNFKKAVYMIGINDLTGGVSPTSVANSVENLLLFLKTNIPELQVVLVNVAQCPARAGNGGPDIQTQVSETNVLYKRLCAKYDWLWHAEIEYSFCNSSNVPLTSWFKDGLHPTAAGYKQKLIPAIISAWNHENQPVISGEEQSTLLREAKDVKLCALTSYGENGFRATEWATAKTYYNQAVAAIEACTTVAQVQSLDISGYITSLKNIKHNSDYFMQEILAETYANDGSNYSQYLWETAAFSNAIATSTNNVYNLIDCGHRLNSSQEYADVTFTFKLFDNNGSVGTCGVLFRARQTSARGIEGYYINIVTDPNYIQVWYFDNSYATNEHVETTYIGGWVFPGEVENTLFRAVVSGTYVYIYTEQDYQNMGAEAYGTKVDLWGRSKYFASGYLGVMTWNGPSSKLLLDDIAEYPTTGLASTITTKLLAGGTYSSNASAISQGADNGIRVSGYSYIIDNSITLSDFDLTYSYHNASAQVDVAGFMFRVTKNANNNGLDGYVININTNGEGLGKQFVQIWYMQNCYSTDGSAGTCDYIGGWVYGDSSTSVLNTTLKFSIVGDKIYITGEGFELVVIEVSLVHNGNLYSQGGVGVVSWQASGAVDIKLESVQSI